MNVSMGNTYGLESVVFSAKNQMLYALAQEQNPAIVLFINPSVYQFSNVINTGQIPYSELVLDDAEQVP